MYSTANGAEQAARIQLSPEITEQNHLAQRMASFVMEASIAGVSPQLAEERFWDIRRSQPDGRAQLELTHVQKEGSPDELGITVQHKRKTQTSYSLFDDHWLYTQFNPKNNYHEARNISHDEFLADMSEYAADDGAIDALLDLHATPGAIIEALRTDLGRSAHQRTRTVEYTANTLMAQNDYAVNRAIRLTEERRGKLLLPRKRKLAISAFTAMTTEQFVRSTLSYEVVYDSAGHIKADGIVLELSSPDDFSPHILTGLAATSDVLHNAVPTLNGSLDTLEDSVLPAAA